MKEVISVLSEPLQLKKALQQYQDTCSRLSADQINNFTIRCFLEIFSNLEKSEWVKNVEARSLLEFTVALNERITSLSQSHQKKLISSIANIHRFLVKKKISAKECRTISDLAFKSDFLKIDSTNFKVYWIILVDKLTSLEGATEKIVDYLEDVMLNIYHVAPFYDFEPFTKDSLPWLLKKLVALYNDKHPKELNSGLTRLFSNLLEIFENPKVNEKESSNLFKFCLSSLNVINQNVLTCSYSNGEAFLKALNLFLKAFDKKSHYHYYLIALRDFYPALMRDKKISMANSERGIMNFIYKVTERYDNVSGSEFLCAVKRILYAYLADSITRYSSSWTVHMPIPIQLSLIKLIIMIMKQLSNSDIQTVTCENCNFKNGVHDGVHLVRFIRSFISTLLKNATNISPLIDAVYECEKLKFDLLKTLFENKCPNWKYHWTKFEVDTHNNAISFYSQKLYDDSLRHFQLYCDRFAQVMSWDFNSCDLNNLSRVFYNMAICQLDMKQSKDALESCYIYHILRAHSEKCAEYTDFSFQIKSKIYSSAKDSKIDISLQTEVNEVLKYNLTDAAKSFLLKKKNAIFKNVFAEVDYSKLLLNEFATYFKFWSSSHIIGHMCDSFKLLMKRNEGDFYTTVINAGKAAILIGLHTNKMNENIIEFIKYTTTKLQTVINNSKGKSPDEILTAKVILASCLQISYECAITEMRKAVQINSDTLENKNSLPAHETPHPDDSCDVTPTHHLLTVKKEYEAIKPLLDSISIFKDIISQKQSLSKLIADKDFKLLTEQTIDLLEKTVQILTLHHLDTWAIIMIDIGYAFSLIVKYNLGIVKFTSALLESARDSDASLQPLINVANPIAMELTDNNPDIAYEYFLNLASHYFYTKQHEKGAALLMFVNCKMAERSMKDDFKIESLKVSYPKLSIVSTLAMELFPSRLNSLTTHVHAHSECTELMKVCADRRNRQWIVLNRLWLDSAVVASKVAISLGLLRRARGLLKSPLEHTQRSLYPQRSASILILLANVDLFAERYDDCRVKLDGLSYILYEKNEKSQMNMIERPKSPVFRSKLPPNKTNEDLRPIEAVLDVPMQRSHHGDSIGSSPTFQPSPFRLPEFVDHTKDCICTKCSSTFLLALNIDIGRLEAILRSRMNSNDAESFFNGSWSLLKHIYVRKCHAVKNCSENLTNALCKTVLKNIGKESITAAECRLSLDTNLYYFSNGDVKNCTKILDHVDKLLAKNTSCLDDFISQEVNEQRMYLQYLKSKLNIKTKQYYPKDLNVEQLSANFSSKLKLTPEKKNKENVFKTPINKKPPGSTRKIAKPSRAIPEEGNFVKPSIKLVLDEEDENSELKVKRNENDLFDSVAKTPTPNLKGFKVPQLKIESPKRYSRSSRSKTEAASSSQTKKLDPKHTLKRSTSPNCLISESKSSSSGNKKYTTRKRNV